MGYILMLDGETYESFKAPNLSQALPSTFTSYADYKYNMLYSQIQILCDILRKASLKFNAFDQPYFVTEILLLQAEWRMGLNTQQLASRPRRT